MRFFDVGQRAEGVIAIGQEATGIFALGQIATGVIAIGQLARGVVAIGQLSIGMVSVGMLSFGLVHSSGLGAGGRSGPGLVLPLVPVPRKRATLPERTTLESIRASGTEGWIDVTVQRSAIGTAEILHQGAPLATRLAPKRMVGVQTFARLGGGAAIALVVPSSSGPTITRIMANPNARAFNPILAAIQIVLLAALALGYWELVLIDLGDFLVRVLRDFAQGIFT